MSEKKDNRKWKAARAAAVTVAAAGVVAGTLFDAPGDLVPELSDSPVAEEILDNADGGDDAQEQKKRGPAARLRGWVLDLPEAVRMLVGLPLWAVGWVVMTGISALVGTAAAPVARVVSWLCLSAILLAVFTFAVKAAFPELPVRQILRGRNVVFITTAALILGLADLALPTVWTGYDARTQLVWRIGATCLLVFVCSMALARHGKVRVAVDRELTEEEIRSEARRLANSVTPGDL